MRTAVAEPSSQAKQELAEQFRLMMEMSAWKHFEGVMRRLYEMAVKDEDNVPLDEVSIARIAECRGRRKAIDKLRDEVQFIVYGLK